MKNHAAPAALSEATRESARRATILLLDDEPDIARFVESVFSQDTYSVEWAKTVDEARQKLAASKPDILLIDINLQGEQGWPFLEHVRRQSDTRSIPVAMLTGSVEAPDRERSLRMGADRYLVKPVRPATLRRVVRELLAASDDIWWSLSLPTDQVKRMRDLLFDMTTEVPTLALVVEELRNTLERGETLQIFCIEIEPLFRLGERDLWESFDQVKREFVRALQVVIASMIGHDVIIATSHAGANDFYCFTTQQTATDLVALAREVEEKARKVLREVGSKQLPVDEVAVFAGAATTQIQPVYAPRILYNGVREAKDAAERRETRYFQGLAQRLTRVIRERTITTHFQPILDLASLEIVGYEALSRGPIGSEIENPEIIFDLARDFQLVWELESLCIENVEPLLPEICAKGALFFNLESHFIQQLHHRGMQVLESFLSCGSKIVIEVTERSAIRDYATFRRTLHDLKALGFMIAIDDCGSGYATLEAIAELRPDYLKVGHSLLNGLEKDPIRRRLVDLVARCAETIGAETIAEAIETEEQLNVCRELGIQKGQGYYFTRPAAWESIRDVRFD